MNATKLSPCRAVFARSVLSLLTLTVLLASTTALRADIGYQFVTVGNPGNANDPASSYGEVDYSYAIGQYDVTLNQYTTFLNAVAQTDPYGLYNSGLENNGIVAGITQSGSFGSYSYAVIGSGNRPVAYISWLDAARFANWMNNGQPTGLGEVAGSTEQGAYTLNGDISNGLELKNANASYWIPGENEWYKAAYYDPNKGGAGVAGYWTYATRSDTQPGNDDTHPTIANQANYGGTPNHLTDVGLFSNSASAYGTYDQNGDLYQWNDAVDAQNGGSRVVRGGSWYNSQYALQSTTRLPVLPTVNTDPGIGFRIASAVPEPGTTASLIVAGGLLLARRRNSRI